MVERDTEDPLGVEINRLAHLPLDALRAAWRQRFREPPPQFRTQDLLARAFAYRPQARAYGDLRAHSKQALARAAKQLEKAKGALRPRPVLSPGAVLVKIWNGTRHEIEVLGQGFAYQGIRYRSLSAIASKIAGVKWNGPRFFGLDKQPTARAP